MTDYKQLCADLVAWAEKTSAHYYSEPEILIRARAVLARWGNHPGSPDSSTPQPIPVSERLPGDQLCWWFEADEDCGYGSNWTLLRIKGSATGYTHWLSAHALPLPSHD